MGIEISDPIFHDEDAARRYFEALRWPEGVVCPLCGVTDQAAPLKGESMGPGWYYCAACKGKFTVRVGTVYERSHIPLSKWAYAFHKMNASKKGISAHQLHRELNITYKSAWFMAHRIREAMRESDPGPIGGGGKVVEADETYIGPGQEVFVTGRGWQKERSGASKRKVVTLVERGGRARSIKVDKIDATTIREVLMANVARESRLHTDELHLYRKPGREFATHERVNHSKKEYARGDVTTNTVEGFFSIFKRGMKGVYHHCGEHHLQRYLHEFDFRYSNRVALGVDDTERAQRAIKGANGKRLTYRPLSSVRAA